MLVLLGVILYLAVGVLVARGLYVRFFAERWRTEEENLPGAFKLAHEVRRDSARITLGVAVLTWPAVLVTALIIGAVLLLEYLFKLLGRLALGGK